MGKIFILIGKSSSGKDTLYKFLLKEDRVKLRPAIQYTTRPMRPGEKNGENYYFVCDQWLKSNSDFIVESRTYNVLFNGKSARWTYATLDSSFEDIVDYNYLVIGTLESYSKIAEVYGHDIVIPIYVEVDDYTRLNRALDRESNSVNPNYLEVCRRFIADSADFSDDKLIGIKRFINNNLFETIREIEKYMEGVIDGEQRN